MKDKIFNISVLFAYDLEDRNSVDVFFDRLDNTGNYCSNSNGYYNISNASISRVMKLQTDTEVTVCQFDPEIRPGFLPWSRRLLVEFRVRGGK